MSVPNYEPIDRLTVLQELRQKFRYKKYLEIGCDHNSVFSHLICDYKIGIDPVRGGNLKLTSDQYFSLSDDTFDLIFIDGLHYYDQVKKDFENSMARLRPNGTIVLHDLLPTKEFEVKMPIPEPLTHSWTGDVWRFSFDLMARPDINFSILNSPYGLGVVTRGQQIPKIFEPEATWEWYAHHWQHLPIVSCMKTLSAKFSNLIAQV